MVKRLKGEDMPARKPAPPKSPKKRSVKGSGNPPNGHGTSWMQLDEPTLRPLKVYALDPSAGNYIGNVMTINVRWERGLQPGPVGSKIAVVDYDGANKCYYPPVDLNDHRILARGGLDPSESDPRFHQQMVYAVASETIEKFEAALGRRIHWRRADRPPGNGKNNTWRKTDDIWVLNLFPHAMIQANAFYSPEAKGILFGYFKAQMTNQGHNLPGQRVFTCLSHDIVAHEVTHAVIDGIRSYFTEPTNPDVLAFHEGFADLAALFSHFSHKEALIDTIQKTGGRLYQFELKPDAAPPARRNGGGRANGGTGSNGGEGGPSIVSQLQVRNPLIDLAQQFGEASGMNRGLRSALGVPPNSDDINKQVNDAHFRGSILVAAVFDAYFSVYIKRTSDLFRIFRAGGGSSNPEELPSSLANCLAEQASATASEFFQLCARALEYCAPVDITFGDFLRALITVNFDMNPDSGSVVRDALMQAFRVRGIYPDDASFFSEDALRWPRVPPWSYPPVDGALPPVTAEIKNPKTGKVETMSLIFGSPNGQTREENNINGAILRRYAQENAAKLGFDPDPNLADEFKPYAPSFHPVFRIAADGSLRTDMVVDLVQTKRVHFDPHVPRAGSFPMRGGVTLIVSEPHVDAFGHSGLPEVRYAIRKDLTGPQGERRQRRQAQYLMSMGMADGKTDDPKHFQVNFGLLHQGF
jgi:hypothetical protein